MFYIADIDECAIGTHECSELAICKNNLGSYKCMCKPNFTGDGRTCTGIVSEVCNQIRGISKTMRFSQY